ncbi:MAG: nucleoside-diphosphate kinase [Kiritimatiellae bacterium]|nr:nucleoside-diphosphate kinase [Kiritimatiellia bacterium]
MASETAFVLINPYTIRKSRTGGVIGRYLARTDLKLAGARLFGPSRDLACAYAGFLLSSNPEDPGMGRLVSEYVRQNYAPDPQSGRPHRVMMLLFEGEDAVRKIREVTGSARLQWGSGQTVRDTYGDYIEDAGGRVTYFEPAVLIGPSLEVVNETLRIWCRYLPTDSGIVRGAMDLPGGDDVEQTLVLLKPDNFRIPSLRAGNILGLLSCAGLRMVCVKKFAMSVAQAEDFYGPVRDSLRKIFPNFGVGRAAQALSREFGFPVDEDLVRPLCESLAPRFAEREFENIVEFMAGCRPAACAPACKQDPGASECLAVVYEGVDAVRKIRDLLGATDPNKARPGSVRREFGTSIMINAAHASDSTENARREMRIIDVANPEPFLSVARRQMDA